MNELEAIDRLLFQCNLPVALPDEVKREIIRSKKTVLVDILRQTGKYTVSIAIILHIALLLKKIGIGVSATKIGVALHAAVILTTATTVAGTGTVIYRTYAGKAPEKTGVTALTEKTEEPVTAVTRPDAANVSEIGIIPFSGKPEIVNDVRIVQNRIFKTIAEKTAPGTIVSTSGDDGIKSRLILSGSVSLINGTYYIRVKLVDAESSRIVFTVNRTADTREELEKASGSIADEIRRQVK